jgi:hypothetical protein
MVQDRALHRVRHESKQVLITVLCSNEHQAGRALCRPALHLHVGRCDVRVIQNGRSIQNGEGFSPTKMLGAAAAAFVAYMTGATPAAANRGLWDWRGRHLLQLYCLTLSRT